MRGLRRAVPPARSTGSYRRVLLLGLVTAVLVVTAGAATGEPAEQRASAPAPLRLVLSSRATQVGTSVFRTLLGGNPWKRYLASDRTCPGAERIDLPIPAQADAVACLINFARRERGLRPLAVVSVLNRASVDKANAIRRCENFAHNPCGGDWTSVVTAAGYRGAFGENLYMANGRFRTPRAAVLAWLTSPPHRKNLFRPGWREQGLALMTLTRFSGYRDVSLWVSVLGDR